MGNRERRRSTSRSSSSIVAIARLGHDDAGVVATQLAAHDGLPSDVALHLEAQDLRPLEPREQVLPVRDALLDSFADEAAVVPCVLKCFHRV